jgi:hypothetical protein
MRRNERKGGREEGREKSEGVKESVSRCCGWNGQAGNKDQKKIRKQGISRSAVVGTPWQAKRG